MHYYYIMIQYNVLYSDIIQYTILNMLDTTLQCSVQYITVSYNTIQYSTIHYSEIPASTLQSTTHTPPFHQMCANTLPKILCITRNKEIVSVRVIILGV